MKTQERVSGGQFGSSSTGTFKPLVLFRWGEESVCRVLFIGDHCLFNIGWSLAHYSINGTSRHPLIEFISIN